MIPSNPISIYSCVHMCCMSYKSGLRLDNNRLLLVNPFYCNRFFFTKIYGRCRVKRIIVTTQHINIAYTIFRDKFSLMCYLKRMKKKPVRALEKY